MCAIATAAITGLDADIAALKKELLNAMAAAMPTLKDDMESCLSEHIKSDVYDVFSPREYVRRGENGGLADIEGSSFFDVRQNGIRMVYMPSGESDQVESPLSGDELIGRIENKQPDYNWSRKPGKRPFFRNFVHEMITSGRAERSLVNAMNQIAKDFVITADGVSTDADDGEI